MASNLLKAGTDLDSVLAPLGTFTARANVGIQVAGTDIAQRYAPAVYGTPAAATGFQTGGSDIGPLFAAIGSTTSYSGTLTAATIITSVEWGYVSGTGGSVSPAAFRGNTITQMTSQTSTAVVFEFAIATNPGSNYFTTLTVATHSYTASAASYSFAGGRARWTWTGTPAFAAPGTYSLSIT